MLGKVFKAYDVRGKYPDPLTEKMARQIGCGVARFLLSQAEDDGDTSPMMRNVVVGRDMRTSSPSLTDALVEGLNAYGADVLDVGLVDTPFIYFAINHLDCAGGVMTTASHNPSNYNGFKISKRRAKPVGESSGLGEIRKFAAMLDVNNGDGSGRREKRDLWEPYIDHVLCDLDLRGRTIKVVIDASNGMAGTMVPKVFGKKGESVDGLEIIPLNFDNSKGEFVHEPNPLVAANLDQLREAVIKHGADLGICFDGDADRCVVVDEKGGIVGCDHLTGALAAQFLSNAGGSGSVVYDLRSTRALPEAVEAAGGSPVRSRVGHVFMKAAMAENQCVFGGELSGHFYFRENFNADSGAMAMVSVLNLLAKEERSMSSIIEPMRRYTQSGEINFTVEEADEALATFKEQMLDEGEIDELDGVTIDCFQESGWWCNVRKSNTEPLLRLNLEARDPMTLESVFERISPMLGERVEH